MRIGGQDVLLPTTMVGNYPNPRWYDGHAFAVLPKGEFIHDSISKEAFEDVVGAIVHDQEAAGMDVIGRRRQGLRGRLPVRHDPVLLLGARWAATS